MERRPGKPGLVVVLADVSASMTDFNKMLADELALVERKIPRLRVFAFAEEVKEVSPRRLHKVHVGYGTNMLLAMNTIVALNPERTLVMSDAEVAFGVEILRIAGQMTGRIDAFYCSDSRFIPRDPEQRVPLWHAPLMQDLARCGHGRMVTLDIANPSRPQLREELSRSFFQPQRQGGNPMKRYPDQHIYGDQIDFRQPPRRRIDMTQHIDVHHQTVFNHIRHAPRQIEHGEPGQQTVYIQGARINMHQPPAEQRHQIADRGHIVEVRHQQAALPKPGIRMPGTRQLALPAPSMAQGGRPLGLPAPNTPETISTAADARWFMSAPQQQPMQRVSARASVLEAFARVKR